MGQEQQPDASMRPGSQMPRGTALAVVAFSFDRTGYRKVEALRMQACFIKRYGSWVACMQDLLKSHAR